RDLVGPWETFELEYLPGNRVALRAVANRQLVCAEDGGAGPLTASRTKVGPWESFEIVPL
ncbi:MAG: fascin domain-containing protein, partial [Betaproteobacteria bacterium]